MSQALPERAEPPRAPVTAHEVRAVVLCEVAESLEALGLRPDDVPDDFDLLQEGVIDSLGLLETIAAVEERFGIEVDFEQLAADDLTVIGAFCRYVARAAG